MPRATRPKRRSRKTASAASRHSLDPIFRPRSVAVIGASRRRQAIGHEILRNLIAFEFNGPVYPVNASAGVVLSMKAYPSILDVPDPVDLAVIVVPRDHALDVLRQCGEKGVKGLVVITAGFREVDSSGADLELEMRRIIEQHGMRMVGPNCMGVINTEPAHRLNASFAAQTPERGKVGFISQSGALGEAILSTAAQTGLGVSMFVSMGNKTDISGNDLLEYWEDNDDVRAILMYLESFGNPKHFTRIARRVTRKKPVITVKAGRTAAGARAAISHTGSIAGFDRASEALLEQCGVLRVSSMEQLFVQASALVSQPVPTGKRVAVVTNAGGPGILCTDALVALGVDMATFRPSTVRHLEEVLPAEASPANPVDMIASADAARYREVLTRVRRDPNVDAIVAIFVSPIMIDAYEVAVAIGEQSGRGKPILCVFMGKQRSDEGIQHLRDKGVPVYLFPEDAASAMGAMCRYREFRDRPAGKPVRFKVDRERAKAAIRAAREAGRTLLTPHETTEILEAYRFPLAKAVRAHSAAEAIAAAQELGYPVVLKAASDHVSHKTDVGGVKLDLRNADEVGEAFRAIRDGFSDLDADVPVAVQRHMRGQEVILGMARDPQFGPLLMFGLGGIFVEVMQDVSIHVHPLTDLEARGMIERIRGYPILAGTRGDAGVDLKLIERTLLRLSQLVGDLEADLAELDLNPFIVSADAGKSCIVDARVSLLPADDS